ncbi:MAG: hypothetical protein ABJC88_16890 [Parasphingorhabdus sp.]|uniref:hypothetical protein n=1 Tax=Sphingomonadales TaxID=204457 RepID=UPI00326351F0
MTNEELLAEALSPKSDTLAGDDLLTGPRTITITGVVIATGSERPLVIGFDGDKGRPWKPCKTTGRSLVKLWGGDFDKWIGRSVELQRDPTVKYAGEQIGGIRIKSASHINGAKDVAERLNGKQIKVRKIGVLKMDANPEKVAPDVDHSVHLPALEAAAKIGVDALKAAYMCMPDDAQAGLAGHKKRLFDIATAADATDYEESPATDGFGKSDGEA